MGLTIIIRFPACQAHDEIRLLVEEVDLILYSLAVKGHKRKCCSHSGVKGRS